MKTDETEGADEAQPGGAASGEGPDWMQLVNESPSPSCEAYFATLAAWLEGDLLDEKQKAQWRNAVPLLILRPMVIDDVDSGSSDHRKVRGG